MYQQVVALADDAPSELWCQLAASIHRSTPFDVVAAVHDNGYLKAAEIALHLELPCSADSELFKRVQDKSQTRAALALAGVPSCRYRVANGEAALRAAVEEIGYPCVVKPLDGSGSWGVSLVNKPDDMSFASHRAGPEQVERGMLVEEYLLGEEFSVEAISIGREHRIVAITKKFTSEPTFIEQGHLVPAELGHADQDRIREYVVATLDALGFHDCPSHTEIILTATGPRLVETHNRVGGDEIADLVMHATGVDLYDLAARQSLGEDIAALLPAAISASCWAAIWFAAPSGTAELNLTEVAGMAAACAVPDVAKVQVTATLGPGVGEVRHSFHRSAWAIAVSPTGQAAVEHAQQAIDALKFTYVWQRPT